ncbi:hypothetical protein [Thalassomonas actiniarum]|uniref:Lipocalin-like domain-containing protein n=1 Tax=Thalassomonas actiniarum TaxID=485447 RepID=A0AAE9YUT6_9GAMM|nr:hypothetical protein [Thalassomonas actiniarum]WDE01521.1 hypothetical protein SG35_013410 [Thalassomonas actiniarum]
MKNKITTILAASLFVMAFSAGADQHLLPDWEGQWQGTCQYTSKGGNVHYDFPMGLNIANRGAQTLNWHISYGEGESQQLRKYQLQAQDVGSGHYVVDENNGILIDSYLVNDALMSHFSVGTSELTTRYEIKGNEMTVDMLTFGR